MESARDFRDLLVWEKAHSFVLMIYKLTSSFPKDETYGLISQLRRAAVSIPANIAEGFVKKGKADEMKIKSKRIKV
jgi:four helix bundle protein